MPIWKQRLFARLQDPAKDDLGGGGGGGGGGDDAAAIAAAAAAETARLAAEAAAAGGAKPSDAEAKLIKEVMQKKDALAKTTTDLTAAQARLKEFDGIDPVAIRALLADKAKAETAALEAAGSGPA